MSTVHIPESITAAVADLSGLDRLLTAREWERAAIVAAFVALGMKPGPKDPSEVSDLSSAAFAALGISGLKSEASVRFYAKAWESSGLPRPKPGETVELPELPWPPQNSAVEQAKNNTKAVAEAMADPVVAQKVIDRMDEDTKAVVGRKVTQSQTEDIAVRTGGRVPQPGVDYNRPSNPEASAAIAKIERESKVLDLITRLKKELESYQTAYGSIRPDHELGKSLFELNMTIAMFIVTTEDEIRR